MIEVVPYDKEWAVRFLELQHVLSDALRGIRVVSIEHVGSTSVPGLAAKPIIDIDVVVSGEDVVAASEALARIGFVPRGDLGVPDRYAFFAPKNLFPTHTYVVVEGCLSLRNHIAVRDTLRSDEALRDEYGALKFRLAELAHNIDQYVRQKSPLLQRILAQAGITPEELLKIENVNKAT
jgi:GrpB-like predicted nucleotidyltransferase (UPF0157 family)